MTERTDRAGGYEPERDRRRMHPDLPGIDL